MIVDIFIGSKNESVASFAIVASLALIIGMHVN
jgi:hypothetical protein